jgi:histidine triad (HIT) family protein
MASVFSKIVAGEIPCYRVAENELFLAFLDVNPLQKGHVLVIPKAEVDYFFDLDDNTIAAFNVFAKKVANALKLVMKCERVGVAVLGFEVPHAHMHLVPMNGMNDLNFSNPKLTFSKDEMANIAQTIRDNI